MSAKANAAKGVAQGGSKMLKEMALEALNVKKDILDISSNPQYADAGAATGSTNDASEQAPASNEAHGSLKGKMWLSTVVKMGGTLITGIGVLIESGLTVAGAAIAETGFCIYEGYQAYKYGAAFINRYNDNFNKALPENHQ